MRTWASAALLLVATVCAGCPRRPVPPEVRAVRVPSGCEANLSGTYTFKGREDWRYLASDDGGTLVLRLLWTSPDGGVGENRADRTAIVLERTSDGFAGATHAVAWPTQSVACPVSFPTEVKACRDDGLVLRTVDAIGVDESCRVAPGTSPMREVEVLRSGTDR
jgi:hypothetical protein